MADERDRERLVRAVTERVLARLEGHGGGGGEGSGGHLLVLLPLPTAHLGTLSEQVERLRREGYDVRMLVSRPVRDALQAQGALADVAVVVAEDGGDAEALAELETCAGLILGSVGFGLLRRLRDLDDDDPFVRVTTQALLRGLPAFAVTDDLTPPGVDGSRPVVAAGERLLRELTVLGVTTCAGAELAALLRRHVSSDGTRAPAASELLTEAEVDAFATRGERRLVIPGRAIVTPLARARALELGLEIIEEETR